MSSFTTEFVFLDFSAEKTSKCEARLAAGPDLIKEASLLATALVKLFIKKKSAPPCPHVFAGGATIKTHLSRSKFKVKMFLTHPSQG